MNLSQGLFQPGRVEENIHAYAKTNLLMNAGFRVEEAEDDGAALTMVVSAALISRDDTVRGMGSGADCPVRAEQPGPQRARIAARALAKRHA